MHNFVEIMFFEIVCTTAQARTVLGYFPDSALCFNAMMMDDDDDG